MELTDDEEKAMMCLISVLKNNLVVKLEEVTGMQATNEFKLNVTFAHNFLGPLTGECILNDFHEGDTDSIYLWYEGPLYG